MRPHVIVHLGSPSASMQGYLGPGHALFPPSALVVVPPYAFSLSVLGMSECVSPPLPNLRLPGFARRRPRRVAGSRHVSERSGGGRHRSTATDHQPRSSCRRRAGQATAHRTRAAATYAVRFRADGDQDGLSSREVPSSMVEWTEFVSERAASSRSTRAATTW